MPATEMIVSIAVVSSLVVAFVHLLRLAGTAMTHRTIRQAIERDPSSAEQLLSRLGKSEPVDGDDRLAVVLVALGLAMIGASLIAGEVGDWTRYGVGGALFPLIIGAALWLRHYAIQRARRHGEPK